MEDTDKKKLEMLERFYKLEQKKKEITTQMQRLQAMGNQVLSEQDTLNKQFEFLNEIDKKEEK